MLTGGWDNSVGYLDYSTLYPGVCNLPWHGSLFTDGDYRAGHVTFLTFHSPPRVASCGGANAENTDCVVLHNGSWIGKELDDLPEPRRTAAVARLNEGVFILGGGDENNAASSVFLRANTTSWVSGPVLPEEMIWGPCAAPISDYSFLIVYGTAVYEFDTKTAGPTDFAGWRPQETWPELPSPREMAGCAVFNQKFIVAGGSKYRSPNYIEFYESTVMIDVEKRTLDMAGDMSKTRDSFHIISARGTLYAAGGYTYNYRDKTGHNLEDVEEFVEETGTWKPSMNLPDKRRAYGGVAVTTDIVCV